MRKDAWMPKQDWAIISGLLAGKKRTDIACEIGRTIDSVYARIRYLRENNLVHKGQTLNALIARHVSLQKKQRDARLLEERKNWSRKKKRSFAEENRVNGPTYIARQLGCSVQEVRELLAEDPTKKYRTRPCVRCRTVFTTPHKCRFMCDNCNAYASSIGWV